MIHNEATKDIGRSAYSALDQLGWYNLEHNFNRMPKASRIMTA